MDGMGSEQDFEPRCQMMRGPKQCPICSNIAMRAEINECPLCNAHGLKPELDALARQWIEEYLDRDEDQRVFGTPKPKVTIQ